MPEGLPHKVSQIRHDLDDLYELMSQVQQSQVRTESVLHEHGNQIGKLQQSLDLHTVRLDRIENNQHQFGGRLDRIGENQHQFGGRLDRIGDNQHQFGDRLEQVESGLDRIENNQRQQFDHLSAQLAEILGALPGPAAAGSTPESE